MRSPCVSILRRHAVLFVVALLAVGAAGAQVPSRNVNMVSGTDWPGGDPFLQRQNEPSVAVSTRNPMHLLAGANDYRTVDLPGLPDDRMTGDAWLGVFTSTDGGATWKSTLVPGYPQELSSTSPLHGFDAGADPVVRAGPHGLFYYSGIVFDRDNPVLEARAHKPGHTATAGVGTSTSAVFVARYIDNNVKENGNPIAHLGTTLIASNANPNVFLDKPWLAVDMPRLGAGTCTITQTLGGKTVTQTLSAGNVYLAYSQFTGKVSDGSSLGKLMFSRSTTCGATWSAPIAISGTNHINQGATIALDPRTGTVYVVWRRFAWPLKPSAPSERDAILIARSLDRGKTFSAPEVVREFQPFDQGTGGLQFRTSAFPTAGVDRFGRVLVAYSTRGVQQPDGDARVVITWARYPSRPRVLFTSDEDDGTETGKTGDARPAWTTSTPVDPDVKRRGHQIMPSMLVTGMRVQIAWVDLQEDHSWGVYVPIPATGQWRESRELSDERKNSPGHVFNSWISDGTVEDRRHSADVWVAQADPGDRLAFTQRRASSYKAGARWDEPDTVQQLQFNPPNLPLFKKGSAPFWGDYIDLGAQPLEQKARLRWRHALQPTASHVVFTDNRDVRAPVNNDWTSYTPPRSAALEPTGTFQPGTAPDTCDPVNADHAGMRNQNIYTARVSQGLYVAAPGNSKPLGRIQRAFVAYAENNTYQARTFRMSIASQPTGGSASFKQFAQLTELDVTIGPRSAVSRTVYVRSTDPRAQVTVDVREVSGGVIVPPASGGLQGAVILNPDVTTPDMMNPDMMNPDMMNPDVLSAEIYTPDMMNPDMMNPDMMNPDMMNPDMMNPDMMNPDMMNLTPGADVKSTILNPDMMNPDMMNADATNAAMTDTVWTLTNNGNTTAAYDVKMMLRANNEVPDGFKTQLFLYKTYLTPVARKCELTQESQNLLIASVPNPPFGHVGDTVLFNPADGSPGHTTLWLAPGDSAKIALRVFDPDRTDGVTFDPVSEVTAATAPQSVDTVSAAAGKTTPDVVSTSPIVFLARPTAAPIGAYVTPPVEVLVQDEDGDPIAGVPVTLSLVSNPAGATLHGGTATTNGVGVAAFSQTWLDRLGSGYRLRASTGTRTSEESGPFDVVPLVVSTTSDAGPGSLRAAIDNANRNAGYPDAIAFDIPGSGPHTIAPSSPLPVIADPVTIDGSTQPGFAGTPVIELNGLSAGSTWGLYVSAGGSTIRGLVINGFYFEAIRLIGGSANFIQGNFIGTDVTGTSARPNNEAIMVASSSANLIGGTSPADRNVIAGNLADGISISTSIATGNQIVGNFIGTDATGTAALGTGQFGVYIANAPGNVVGGSTPGAGNVIAASTLNGVRITGGPAVGNRILGNRIGTNASGTGALGNTQEGVWIGDHASGTLVGGPDTSERNLISGNGSAGVLISSGGGNLVRGNWIGLDAEGTGPLGNGVAGVRITSVDIDNSVGGSAAGEGNVISGNPVGVSVQAFGKQVVEGNRIGTNVAGDGAVGNSGHGVFLGVTEGAVVRQNLISGNGGCGVAGGGSGTRVTENDIGTNMAGTTALGNGASGVCLGAGPVLLVRDNLVSGNLQHGIEAPGAAALTISANRVGTDAAGTGSVPNQLDGIHQTGGSSVVGGTTGADGNTVAFNRGSGIYLSAGNSAIAGNRIFSNDHLGISLGGPAPTPNDVGDADDGPNDLLNFPVLASAVVSGGATTVSGTLNSLSGAVFTIQFFSSAGCDASGFGEGEIYEGSTIVSTDGGGNATFSATLPRGLSGRSVTATTVSTIGFAGRTSEFSACIAATP